MKPTMLLICMLSTCLCIVTPMNQVKDLSQDQLNHSLSWDEFMDEYNKEKTGFPEIRHVKKRLSRSKGLTKKAYGAVLVKVVDGTLLDSQDRHRKDPLEEIRTPRLSKWMKQHVTEYLNEANNKPLYHLNDFFDDVYNEKFFLWMEEKRKKEEVKKTDL